MDLKRQSHIGCICSNFSTVRFQMCPQIACPNICKVTSVAFFDFSTLCVFKCFLKELGSEKAKSHWLNLFEFPPLFLSKRFFKELGSKQAKSHWLHLFEFFHCAFSNVSSNCLSEHMQSHIGSIFLLFYTVRFQMFPQIACMIRGVVTLVAFV